MNVLLVDDHRLLLEGLNNLLTAHGIRVAGMARDGLEAITLARALRPDVILMDVRMPGCDGLEATRRIMAERPEAKIVMLTTSTEDQDLFEAVKSGACGYLLKSITAEELIECLDQAQEGIPPFSPGLATKILREFAHRAAPTLTRLLSTGQNRWRGTGDPADRPIARGIDARRAGPVVQGGGRQAGIERPHDQVSHGRDHATAPPGKSRPDAGLRRAHGLAF